MSELMEDGEDSSMPESVEVSEGEGSYQEDKNVSRMGTDPEEDSSVEQQIADGDMLSEREDPAIQVLGFLSFIRLFYTRNFI